ncbi:MAG: response regulator [Rhizobiaceae bacterium]|nr:response regulator [Rhizobiaceae bacterium]
MHAQLKTILVVDDDPKVRLLLRRCLETENYLVLEADGAQSVDAWLEQIQVDLITLDLNLGTENGLNIAVALRAKSDIPIIIVTGKGDVIDKIVGLEMGADDYISKPFHVREVLARVRTVLKRNAGSNDRSRDDALPTRSASLV